MIRLAVCGDTHGNMTWMVNHVMPYARELGASTIVQVGDFGFVWPEANFMNTSRRLNRLLDRAGLDLLFLPGNHDAHDKLAALARDAPLNTDGHYQLRPRIAYTGRVSAWSWDGRRFAAVAGAVSVDRRERQLRRRGVPKLWPEEVLSEDEHHAALTLGPVDVLFTHDAPSAFPLPGLKPDLDSTINRQRMTDLGRALRPKLWWHGHYHTHVVYPFHHDGGVCEVRALARDTAPRAHAIELLNLGDAGSPASW